MTTAEDECKHLDLERCYPDTNMRRCRSCDLVMPKPDRWYNYPATQSRMVRLQPPFENIYVGSDPMDGFTKEFADSFDAFVNVSCSECAYFEPSRLGQSMHWYPVNEMGEWPYGLFFWAKRVLDFHYDKGHRVYLHCHAGAYRSPTTAVWWLVSRGYSLSEASEIERGPKWTAEIKERGDWEGTITRAQRNENIPKNIDKLYAGMKANPTFSLAGILLSSDGWIDTTPEVASKQLMRSHLLHKYFAWYFKPKWALNRLRIDAKWWLKGYRKVPTGTYSYERVARKDLVARVSLFLSAKGFRKWLKKTSTPTSGSSRTP